jgi:hypothetical protein
MSLIWLLSRLFSSILPGCAKMLRKPMGLHYLDIMASLCYNGEKLQGWMYAEKD